MTKKNIVCFDLSSAHVKVCNIETTRVPIPVLLFLHNRKLIELIPMN